MKKYLLATALIGNLLFGAGLGYNAYAQTKMTPQTQEQIAKDKKSLDKVKDDIGEIVVKDAAEAMKNIVLAQEALERKDKTSAVIKLEAALGKLETAISLYPELHTIPLEQKIITSDIYHSVDDVRLATRTALKFLKRGRVQDARLILKDLASEVVVRTTSVPLVAYSDAIKLALPFVKEGEYEKAGAVLDTALSTLVITNKVIPLPVARTLDALLRAQKIEAENETLTKEQISLVEAELDYAEDQIALAEALGYVERDAYKATKNTIKSLRKNLKAKLSNKKNYETVIKDTKAVNAKIKSAEERANNK